MRLSVCFRCFYYKAWTPKKCGGTVNKLVRIWHFSGAGTFYFKRDDAAKALLKGFFRAKGEEEGWVSCINFQS